MANMDVFNEDAFGLISLSAAIDRVPHVPSYLGGLNIFTPEPVNNSTVWVDERDGELALIQTSPRGAPPKELERDERQAQAFKVPRLSKGFTLQANEIASLRAFGSESEQTVVMQEFMRRMDRVRNDMETTHEKMRLGALQGILLDADGSTIFNYFTRFGVAQPAAVSFELDVDTTDVTTICRGIIRAMKLGAKGAWIEGTTRAHALAGDAFFDALISHPNVEKFWLNWQAAAEMRGIDPFSQFDFGGIVFHNYRGTDDNSTVAVASTEVKFFPVGGREIFKHVMAPADEFIPYVGAPGQNLYAMTIRDRDRDAWVRGELYSYPLYMCARPETLQRGTLT
jgi:hypothetical protein